MPVLLNFGVTSNSSYSGSSTFQVDLSTVPAVSAAVQY